MLKRLIMNNLVLLESTSDARALKMKLALKCSINKKSTIFVQIQRNFGNFTHDGQKGKIKQKLQIFLLIANLWASSIFWWSVSMNQGTLVRQSNAKKLLPLKPILALPTLGQIWFI